jgi:hypothetical protein
MDWIHNKHKSAVDMMMVVLIIVAVWLFSLLVVVK